MTLYTVLGDIVGSRSARDRRAMHRTLSEELSALPDGYVDKPHITVGDEFQGTYSTLGAALATTLILRIHLLPGIDVRFGIGMGQVEAMETDRSIQDGPGWWRAREAIEATAANQKKPGLRWCRTTFAPSPSYGAAEAVNAALLARDHLIGQLDERSIRVLRGVLDGRTQSDTARQLGVSPSAVSQRRARDGIDVIVTSSSALGRLR